jgi:hypothetical protein
LIFTVATGCTGIAVQLRFSVSILPAGQSLERAEQELHKKKLQISGSSSTLVGNRNDE